MQWRDGVKVFVSDTGLGNNDITAHGMSVQCMGRKWTSVKINLKVRGCFHFVKPKKLSPATQTAPGV